MHHSKNFSTYSTQKKIQLVLLLIGKFLLFGAFFGGLIFFLKDRISPVLLLALGHVVLIAAVVAVFFIHKHKNREEECDCEVKPTV